MFLSTLKGKHKDSLVIIGYVLITLWFLWWIISIYKGNLLFVEYFWFGKFPAFGVDFSLTVDLPSRTWVQGGDPYAREHIFVYPPLVTRLFAWTSLVSPSTALNISIWIFAFCTILGAWFSWKTRIDLNIKNIPLSFTLAAALFSFPVIFGMERGNYDLLVLPFLVISVWLLKKGTLSSEIIAGLVLSLTPWLKVYPGLLAVGFVALKKWKALIAFMVSGLLIGLINVQETLRFTRNMRIHVAEIKGIFAHSVDKKILPWQHSLTELWGWLWMNTPLDKISGYGGTVLLLGGLLFWVGFQIYRCPKRHELIYPYFTWILALATFVPTISNDYNLFSLPLTVLAVWDRRDPIIVHISLLLLLLWWQPFYLPINDRLFLFIKLFSLVALAVSLTTRCRELSTSH